MSCSGINSQRRFPLFVYEKTELLTGDAHGLEGRVHNRTSGLDTLPGQEERERQHKQIRELYDLHNAALFNYLRSLGLTRDEVEDFHQETFLRLAQHIAEGEDGKKDGNLRSWIFQVAYHLSMDRYRAVRRDAAHMEPLSEVIEEPVDLETDPERIYLQQERTKLVNAAITKLTPQQRSSVLLRAQGMRYIDIGKVLGVSEPRAIYLVKRGLKCVAGGL